MDASTSRNVNYSKIMRKQRHFFQCKNLDSLNIILETQKWVFFQKMKPQKLHLSEKAREDSLLNQD